MRIRKHTMPLMVSISGIRGTVGDSLTPEVVMKYASAFAEYCGRGTIVVGRDGRITGDQIAASTIGALRAMGSDVVDIGIVPTPTVQIAVEKLKAAGGISITASHNPIEWNGLKFLSKTGLFLDAEENREFWAIADEGKREYRHWSKVGKLITNNSLIDKHIELIEKLPFINKRKIRAKKFIVVLDSVNAAGGIIMPRLLERFGCEVIKLNCDVSGVFAHTPEPLPENLTQLREAVKKHKADFGIAVDPDVDRLVLITEKGEPFSEEYTVAHCVQVVLSKRKRTKGAKVVVNLSTTRAVEDIAAKFGANVVRTPVGEINVAKRMRELNATVGGEGSGGVILPDVHLGRDAPVGAALTLQHMAEFGGTLSELKASLPQYFITKGKVELSHGSPDQVLATLQRENEDKARITTDDGLKLDFEESWVHLRKSNTEPIIRIIAEAKTKQGADDLVSEFTKRIDESLSAR